jgi:hypothetical protein
MNGGGDVCGAAPSGKQRGEREGADRWARRGIFIFFFFSGL